MEIHMVPFSNWQMVIHLFIGEKWIIFRFVFNICKKKNNCACLIKFNDEDDGNFLGRINKRDEKPAIRIESGVYVTVCTACCYIRWYLVKWADAIDG